MRNLKHLLGRGLVASLLTLVLGTGAAFAQLNAYVTNSGNNTLSVIDVATNTTVGTIPLPGSPAWITVNAEGSRAYVTMVGSTVAVVDLITGSVVATVSVAPHSGRLTLGGNDAFLYVSGNSANDVKVIDTATNTVVTTVATGSITFGIAATPDDASVWVANVNRTISVIDTATNTVTSAFSVSPFLPSNIVFTPDGALAYITNLFGSNCVVIDTATRALVANIPTGSAPIDNIITPDGATVYQTNPPSANVSVIDTATNTVVATVPMGARPTGLAITPDGAFIYVVVTGSNSVSVISTATNTVVATIPVGPSPADAAITRVIQVPPVLTSDNASVTVDEGQTATNTGTVTDANRETVTLTASVGTVVNNGDGTWSWSFTTSDGPAENQTVTITGDDGNGGVSSTSFSLTVVNVPPTIVSVTNNGPVITGNPATITVTATDPAGANDPFSYEFDCNNDFVFEIGPQAGNSATCNFASAGNYTVNVLVVDGDADAALGSTVVTVLVPPPNCSGAVASPNKLWPPNHKLVPVQISGVTNTGGGALTISVTGIFQDELTDGLGDGNTCPDATGTGTATANLRAERNALGNGRVYTVSFTATGAGGSCQGSVTVCVPHNNNGSCGNGGALFNSGVCNATKASPKALARHKHNHKSLLCGSHLPTLECDLFCDAGLILCQ